MIRPGIRLPPGDVMATAPDEIIRWATPAIYFRRTATRDFDMHGKTVKAGDKVVYWFASGNRDEAAFDAPFRVNLGRTPNAHLSFGQGGPHVCLGMWLARLEVRVLFQELAKRITGIEAAGPHQFLRSNFVGGIKSLPASKISDNETRFCQSTFGVHFDRDLLPSPGSKMMEGLPDMELRWVEGDIRGSWHDGTKVVLGDLFASDGTPLPLCPRGALRRAVAAWEAKGLTPKVGIELEAFAFQKNAEGGLVPYDAPGAVVYGTGPCTDPVGFNDAIWTAAEKAGFQVDMITAEYDAPQFEYTLTFDDALRAVDDLVLFRLLAREVALEHGIILSFLPKPIEEAGGSGMHINFSFTNGDGQNALSMDGKSGSDHMNDLAKGCVAGLVHHHKGLAGILAPTTLSYKRLQPASLTGYWQNWGGDHRNVTTRVSAEGGAKSRLEHRMADASANPYTAVAAVLQAALLGVEIGYDLPAMETGDGFETTDASEGVAASQMAAMDDLAADTVLSAAVGQELVDNQIFMRRAEAEKTAELNAAALRDFYIHFI